MTKVNTRLLRPVLLAALLTGSAAGPAGAAQPRPAPRRVPQVITAPAEATDSTQENRPKAVAPLPGPAQPGPAVRLPAARLRELRADPDLQYAEDRAPEGESLLERLMRWLYRWTSQIRSTRGGRIAWDGFFYALAAGVLVFAALKLAQVDMSRLFGRARRAVPLDYEAATDNIHELNFGEVIAQAEADGNLRLAVRLGYLHLLKLLADRDLLDWQPDKTNQTYLRELTERRPTLRPCFAELTRQFEYVWYGEWPLRPASYRRLREAQLHLAAELGGVPVA